MSAFGSSSTWEKYFCKRFSFCLSCSNPLISNITADEIFNAEELKDLLVKQIENRVRWRESVVNMVNKGVNQFIEIGPGKVLSGLVKRINKEVLVSSINSEEEIKDIKLWKI